MNLGEKFKTLSSDPCYYRGEILRQQQNWLRGSGGFYFWSPMWMFWPWWWIKETQLVTLSTRRGHTHHYVLDVLLHQVALVCHYNRTSKCVQVCVVKLVWSTIDLVGAVHMDIPVDKARQPCVILHWLRWCNLALGWPTVASSTRPIMWFEHHSKRKQSCVPRSPLRA